MYSKACEVRQAENGYIISLEDKIGDGSERVLEFVFKEPHGLVMFLVNRFDFDFTELLTELEHYV